MRNSIRARLENIVRKVRILLTVHVLHIVISMKANQVRTALPVRLVIGVAPKGWHRITQAPARLQNIAPLDMIQFGVRQVVFVRYRGQGTGLTVVTVLVAITVRI